MAVDLGALLAAAHDVIAILDRDGRYHYINDAIERAVGIAPSAFLGKTIDELMPPTDARKWRDAIGHVLATGEPREIERTLDTPTGARTFAARLSRSGDFVCAISRDVTSSQRAVDAAKFLVDASVVLERFDPETSFQQIADLAVPVLADWCFIHLAEPEGLVVAAVAHDEPVALAETRVRLARWVPPAHSSTLARVLGGGPAELKTIDDDAIVNAAMDDAHLAAMRAAGYRSTVIAPLTGRNCVYGAMSFALAKSGRVYGQADLAMFTELARRTAIALENARLFAAEQTARQAAEAARDRTRRLQDLGAALSRAHDQRTVVEVLADAGRAAIGAAAGYAWMLRNPDTLELAALAHDTSEKVDSLDRFAAIALDAPMPICDAVRTSKPLLFATYEQLTRAYPAVATPTPYTSWALFPIVLSGRSLGAVSFSFRTERVFTDEDRDLLMAMSNQASLALERCWLLDSERRSRTEAEAASHRERQLHVLAARLSSALTRDEIASIVCDEAMSALDLQVAAAAVRTTPSTLRVISVSGGRAKPQKHQLEISINDATPTTDAVRTGETIWCATREELDTRYASRNEIWQQQGLGSGGAVPFAFEDRVVGALLLGFAEARDLTENERHLLQAMGQLAAQSIERARLGDAHKQSEERLREALVAARAATWAIQLDTMRSQRDASYRRLVGLSDGNVLGDFENIHPDDRDNARQAFARSLAEGVPYEPFVRLRSDDGTYRWFQSHGRLTYDAAGTPVTMQGVIVDVDEAHRANLRAESERAIIDTMHRIAATFTSELDHDKLVERIVEELRTAIGAETGVFCIGAASADLPEAPSSLEVPIVSNNGHTFGHLHFRHAAPDRFTEEHVRLVTSVAPQAAIALENARLYKALREHGDQLETAVERARAADRRKDEFLAMLGHELRNPLAPIMTALELIEMKHVDGIAKERKVLRRQVDHLSRLLDDLLDVSRITRGKIKLEKQTVELSTILGKAIEMSSPMLDKRRQHLEIATMPGGGLVDADPTRLAQVFQNLLTNASKYSHEGSQISLRTSVTDDTVTVTVRDNGIGIAPELLPHMFDLFVQGERALDRSEGGLGIGLTVARSLTELHDGQIAVASDGLNQGSTFTVTLPRSQRTRVTTESMRPLRTRGSGPTARVLLVDDNVDAAQMLRAMLSEYGHELQVAHDGPSALELAASFKPDIAVLDIGLPVMSGYDLARKLREQLGAEKLRLIAVTGYGQQTDRTRATEVGFDHHLVKPIALDALLDLLAK